MTLLLMGVGNALDAFPAPSTISGLQLWLEAADLSTLFQDSSATTPAASDGDPVGYWGDKSGNSRHHLQATSTKRLTLRVVPEARRSAFNTWVRANLDAGGGDWLTPSLSATGNAPFTHAWFSAALTAAEFKLMMQRLCSLASITPPGDWDTMTRAQRKVWLLSQRSAIHAATGIYIQVMDGDGVWDSPSDVLTAKGLAVSNAAPN